MTDGDVDKFQHTAARRRLAAAAVAERFLMLFQHTAARRRLGKSKPININASRFNTQPPEGGWDCETQTFIRNKSFNTQPPEGGWASNGKGMPLNLSFQHTAARRRLENNAFSRRAVFYVSTHSRPKAAGRKKCPTLQRQSVSTHSRPKAAGSIKV